MRQDGLLREIINKGSVPLLSFVVEIGALPPILTPPAETCLVTPLFMTHSRWEKGHGSLPHVLLKT